MEISLIAYVKGSKAAVDFYIKAFEAELGYNYLNEDGSYMHAEIVKNNRTVLAVSETTKWTDSGHNMQFGINLGDREEVRRMYSILSEDAKIIYDIAPSFYNDLMFDLIDKYGVRWYIAV